MKNTKTTIKPFVIFDSESDQIIAVQMPSTKSDSFTGLKEYSLKDGKYFERYIHDKSELSNLTPQEIKWGEIPENVQSIFYAGDRVGLANVIQARLIELDLNWEDYVEKKEPPKSLFNCSIYDQWLGDFDWWNI